MQVWWWVLTWANFLDNKAINCENENNSKNNLYSNFYIIFELI